MICFICGRNNYVVTFKKTKPPYLCAGCNNQLDKWYEKLYKILFLLQLDNFTLNNAKNSRSNLNVEIFKFFRSKEGCLKYKVFNNFGDLCEIKGIQKCVKCRFRIMFHVYKPASTKSTKRIKENIAKFNQFLMIHATLKEVFIKKFQNVPDSIEKDISCSSVDDYGPAITSPENMNEITINKQDVVPRNDLSMPNFIRTLSELMLNVDATPSISVYLRNPARPNAATRMFYGFSTEGSIQFAHERGY